MLTTMIAHTYAAVFVIGALATTAGIALAATANPKRFTDLAKVEKRFERDCVNVLGRACTAREKGDFITFLAGQ